MVKIISIGPNEGDAFDNEIKKNDALVKFYDPYCPHCVAMAQSWKDLGKMLEKDYDGEISLIEVHADALPKIKSDAAKNVKGYPTILKVTKGGKLGGEYSGNRTVEDMLQFIKDKLDITKKTTPTMKGGSNKKKIKSNRRRTFKTKRKNKHNKIKSRRVNKRRNRSHRKH
jgi:thiol-disulfide isomerase/thioredoxin